MELLCPEHLYPTQGVPEIYDAGALYPWIPEALSNLMPVVDPFTIKCPPAPKETEWEAKKPAIEHIYLTENQNLNATIICMREQHGFAATEKMYKRHFQLWGWHKYTPKNARKEKKLENHGVSAPSSSGDCEPPRKKARVLEELVDSSKAASTPSVLIPVDLKNFQQKAIIYSGITQLFDAHIHTATPSSRSRSSFKYRLLQNSSGPRLLDGIYEALNTLDCDQKLGWEAIERTLDQIQYHIREDDITSFLELCFLVPRALLFSAQSRALRSYLSRFTHTMQEKNIQGPFADVGCLLQEIYEPQREPDFLSLLVFASSAFAAVLVEKYGKENKNSLLATWDSSRLAGQLDPTVASTWLKQWELSHQECMSRFGRHSLLTLGLEDDLSGMVKPSRLYPQTSCPAEVKSLIDSVRRKLFLIPSEESNGSSFEDDSLLFF